MQRGEIWFAATPVGNRPWFREAPHPPLAARRVSVAISKGGVMPVVDESIVINRSRSEVFAFATDPENVPLYNSNMISFEQLTEGPVGKGTRNHGMVRVVGKTIEWTTEVTEFEQDGRLMSRSVESPVGFELDIKYEDADGGTKVTWHQESETFGGFFGKLADPLVNRMYSKDVRSNLEKLKELVEAQ
jgi:uncharacterized membrane protein